MDKRPVDIYECYFQHKFIDIIKNLADFQNCLVQALAIMPDIQLQQRSFYASTCGISGEFHFIAENDKMHKCLYTFIDNLLSYNCYFKVSFDHKTMVELEHIKFDDLPEFLEKLPILLKQLADSKKIIAENE